MISGDGLKSIPQADRVFRITCGQNYGLPASINASARSFGLV